MDKGFGPPHGYSRSFSGSSLISYSWGSSHVQDLGLLNWEEVSLKWSCQVSRSYQEKRTRCTWSA